MTTTATPQQLYNELPPRVNEFKRFTRVLFGRGVVGFGVVVVILFLLTAIFAPWIAPYDPYEQNIDNLLASPSWQHWLGTDTLGRDTDRLGEPVLRDPHRPEEFMPQEFSRRHGLELGHRHILWW